jgi:hypothetical protein
LTTALTKKEKKKKDLKIANLAKVGESSFTRMMRIGFGDGTVCPNSQTKRQRKRVLVSGTNQQFA